MSRLQGHSAAGRIRSIKKFNDLVGNRTHDFPACSIVSQPTALPRGSYKHTHMYGWSCGYAWHCLLLFFFIIGGVGLSPWYCGHFWPIVQTPDDRWGWLWSNWWNEDWQGKPTPAPLCPPQIPHDQTRARTPDRCGGKPATNRLSYVAAFGTV
jgi:hypothetical protein